MCSLETSSSKDDYVASSTKSIFAWPVPAIAATAVFLLTLETVFHVPRRGLTFVLAFLSLLVNHVTQTPGVPQPELERTRKAFADLPKSFDTMKSKLALEPTYIIYAACPECSHLHAPETSPGSQQTTYPRTCQNPVPKRGGLKPCNTNLLTYARTRGMSWHI